MKQSNGEAKIQMLKDSMRCFMFGLFSLLPLIGLGFGVAALVFAGRARVNEQKFWNAAKPYRLIGIGIVGFTCILWLSVTFLIAWHMVQASYGGRSGGYYYSNE